MICAHSLQILTFATGSSSSRWCLGVVGVLIRMHSSTDSDIRPPQANFISQAHITSQAYTLARLTRPWFLICLSMTSQADFISQANITSQAGTRARLTRPWFFYFTSLHGASSLGVHLRSHRCYVITTAPQITIAASPWHHHGPFHRIPHRQVSSMR